MILKNVWEPCLLHVYLNLVTINKHVIVSDNKMMLCTIVQFV